MLRDDHGVAPLAVGLEGQVAFPCVAHVREMPVHWNQDLPAGGITFLHVASQATPVVARGDEITMGWHSYGHASPFYGVIPAITVPALQIRKLR